MNTLYGKWGQKNQVFKQIDYKPKLADDMFEDYNAATDSFYTYRIINGVVERSTGEVKSYNSFYAIASHVTADARMYLWEIIKQAEPQNVFYCDTDSLFTNHSGYTQLEKYLDNNKLGKLKLVEKAHILEIRGLKDYIFGSQEKLKGIKKDAQKLTNSRYLQSHFEGLRSALRKGRINKMIITHQIKQIAGVYSKGRVLQSGQVKPFKINEERD